MPGQAFFVVSCLRLSRVAPIVYRLHSGEFLLFPCFGWGENVYTVAPGWGEDLRRELSVSISGVSAAPNQKAA